MESMVVKVAEAIAKAHLDYPSAPPFYFDALTEEIADEYYEMARAAIEAMREPTPAMMDAGGGCCGEYGCGEQRMKEIFTAMISAALKEHEEGK